MTSDADIIDSGEYDPKIDRIDHPSGWMTVVQYETVRFLIDALLESPPGSKFNKSDLKRRTGMSRDSIREHMPLLVDLGIVKEVDEKGWPEYQLNDRGKVTEELFHLNSAANSVLAGERKNVQRGPEIDLSSVNRSDWGAAQRAQKQLKIDPDG